MIHQALHRPIPVELTADRRMTRRAKRLAATSAVALGLIWVLALTTLQTPLLIDAALAVGWITMPMVLVLGLRRPSIRYWICRITILSCYRRALTRVWTRWTSRMNWNSAHTEILISITSCGPEMCGTI